MFPSSEKNDIHPRYKYENMGENATSTLENP
jgi:hypothetical protein